MVVAVPRDRLKEKEKITKLVEKQRNWFIQLNTIVEEMDTLANSRRNPKILKKILHNRLKTLRNWETKEQWFGSVHKFTRAIEKFLKSPSGYYLESNEYAKERIVKSLSIMSIYEGRLLKETVKNLKPEIEDKTAMEINWLVVRKIIAKLKIDLQNLMLATREIHIRVQE